MKNTAHVIYGASLAIALMLTACQPSKPNPQPVMTSSANPKTVAIDQPFTLKIGESAWIAGEPLKITFVEVILDKRCPKEVSCAVAGEMKLQVALEQRATGKQKQAHMTTGQDNADDGFDWRVAFEGYVVQVIQVKPDASLNKKIAVGDYEVTLTVAQRPRRLRPQPGPPQHPSPPPQPRAPRVRRAVTPPTNWKWWMARMPLTSCCASRT